MSRKAPLPINEVVNYFQGLNFMAVHQKDRLKINVSGEQEKISRLIKKCDDEGEFSSENWVYRVQREEEIDRYLSAYGFSGRRYEFKVFSNRGYPVEADNITINFIYRQITRSN